MIYWYKDIDNTISIAFPWVGWWASKIAIPNRALSTSLEPETENEQGDSGIFGSTFLVIL